MINYPHPSIKEAKGSYVFGKTKEMLSKCVFTCISVYKLRSPILLTLLIFPLFSLYYFNKIPLLDYMKLWGYSTFFHFLPGFYIFSLIFPFRNKINTGNVLLSFPLGIALNAFCFYFCKKLNFDYYWLLILPFSISSLSLMRKTRLGFYVPLSLIISLPVLLLLYLGISLNTIYLETDSLIQVAVVSLIENSSFASPIHSFLNIKAGYILAHLDIAACHLLTNISVKDLTCFLYPCYVFILFMLCLFYFLKTYFKSSIYFYIILIAYFMSNLSMSGQLTGVLLNNVAGYSFQTVSGILGFLNLIALTYLYQFRHKVKANWKNIPLFIVIITFLFLAKAASSTVFMVGITINYFFILATDILKKKKLSLELLSNHIKGDSLIILFLLSFSIFLFYFMDFLGGGVSNHLQWNINSSLDYLTHNYPHPAFDYLEKYTMFSHKTIQIVQYLSISLMMSFYLFPFFLARLSRKIFGYSYQFSSMECLFWQFFWVGFILSLLTYASGGGSHLSFLLYGSFFIAILAAFELKRCMKKLNYISFFILFVGSILLYLKIELIHNYNPWINLKNLSYSGNGFERHELQKTYDNMLSGKKFGDSDILFICPKTSEWWETAYVIYKTKSPVMSPLPFTIKACKSLKPNGLIISQLIQNICLDNNKSDKIELQKMFSDKNIVFLEETLYPPTKS